MDNILDRYKNIIEKDPALYVDIINAYNLGLTEVLESTNSSLILRLKEWPLYFSFTDNPPELIALLEKYDIKWMIARNIEVCEAYKSKGFDYNPCYQVYYDGEKLELKDDLEIIRPKETDLERIGNSYELGGIDAIKDAYNRNYLFSAYKDGTLVGYIGVHDDMSCGMLHVFNEYRGLGYGSELEKFIINFQLDKGLIPYGHVISDNNISLLLQKKINMKTSKGLIFWMWKE